MGIIDKIKSMKKVPKKVVITLVCLVVVVGGVYIYWQSHRLKSDAVTSSSAASAQNDYKGDDRHTDDGQTDPVKQGGAVDNNGDTSSSSDTSKEIMSASGLLSVISPASGDTISTGATLRGTAKNSSEVQYRIIDNTVGVIGQGALKVVNGRYSGTLQFTPQASSGRIDIFTYNSNYQEQNNVQVQVQFKR